LRYGTLPIVRATGGLDDTVEQYDEKTGEGTGFKYHAHTPRAIYDTVGWAVSTWYDRKDHMRTMIRRAMQKDFSWEHATPEYEKLYDKALKIKAAGETGGI
jgi:starch synthase